MRTANPALNARTFSGLRYPTDSADTMTLQGTVNKAAILLFLVLLSAAWVWNLFYSSGNPAAAMPWMGVGAIGGLIAAVVTVFKKQWAGITAPIYALLEGLVLGGVSAMFEARYPGIVIQAVSLTFGTLFCLLMAYSSGMIRATENFKLGVAAATGEIFVIYLVSWILGLFGAGIPFIHESGLIGIGFSLFVVVIAALNLVLDFDFIEQGAEVYGMVCRIRADGDTDMALL